MKEKLIDYLDHFRVYYRSPIHIHSLTMLQLMAMKQCVVCGRIVDSKELVIEPLQDVESKRRANVPLEGKKPSERSYEAQVRNMLSKHRVLTNDGWNDPEGFEELVQELVNWRRGSRAKK